MTRAMTSGTILQEIVETKRREVAQSLSARSLEAVTRAARAAVPPRDFTGALAAADTRPALIAEIKKASPSAGLIRADFDPVAIARTFRTCGAAALSVLTDRTYFQGDLSFIDAVKRAVTLPVLRKDFVIDEYQIYESRAAGADACLLIAEILSVAQISTFSRLAGELGMASLIEVHDVQQLRSVRDLIDPGRRTLLGINNRDLRTQTTDIRTTLDLAPELGPALPFISESGIKTRRDVQQLADAGAVAMLIGETLMRAPDAVAKAHELLGQE